MRRVDKLDGYTEKGYCFHIIGTWYVTIVKIRKFTKFKLEEE